MENNNKPFLKNTWYLAALSSEVNAEDLMRRKIIGESILLYRKEDGTVSAMHDRCPHRFAPLSQGKRVGDTIVCGYHGLTFNADGDCVHSPHGNGKIPKACQVQSFATSEQHGFIWIWMGKKAEADTNKIMDCSLISKQPASATGYIYMHNHCNYQLLTDNIMDLTHIDHLHGPLINTQGKLSPLIPTVTEIGDNVRVRWDWLADPCIPLLSPHLPRPEDDADMFFQVEWQAPAVMHLRVGAVQDSADYDNDGVVLYDYHIMTPETEFTTHYFFFSTRNYLLQDAEYNDAKMEGMQHAFVDEDKPMIEAQQGEMGSDEFWSLNPVLLSSDAGGIRVRRKLASLIEAELD